jgi:hypothetical protein
MDRIGYQARNATKEMWEEVARKQEEQQKKVQDQSGELQQMLEATSIAKEHKSREGPSTGLRREVGNVQSTLTQLTVGHRTLQIEIDVLELPMGELHGKVNALGYLNIVISRIPMHRLQYLQAHLLQEIKTKGEEAKQELLKMMDERD